MNKVEHNHVKKMQTHNCVFLTILFSKLTYNPTREGVFLEVLAERLFFCLEVPTGTFFI